MNYRTVLLAGLFVLGGCAADATAGSSSNLVQTSQCEISGVGSLPAGDFINGQIDGTTSGATGNWTDISPVDGVIFGGADWIFCRIDGEVLGDFEGTATVDGAGSFTYRVHVQDRSTPGQPTLVEGSPTTQTLEATRTYRPSHWVDGQITARTIVTVPEELPVTVGNAGNQWAFLTLHRFASDDEVVCRYRGGARTPVPYTREQLAAGQAYHFERCTGEAAGTSLVEAGTAVDALDVTLHVQSGAHFLPCEDDDRSGDCGGHGDHGRSDEDHGRGDDGDHGRGDDGDHGRSDEGGCGLQAETTVTVDLDVIPFVVDPSQRDYYRLTTYDSAGNQLILREGDLATGDLHVVQL